MVSKAREDLPEPETPVMTTSLSRGMTTSMFLRLCSRAPRTMMASRGMITDLPRLALRQAQDERLCPGGQQDSSFDKLRTNGAGVMLAGAADDDGVKGHG